MIGKLINTTELQIVEIIIKNCYMKLETHKLESHLYMMFDTKNHEDTRPLAEELLDCVNEYMYSYEEPLVNVDFKRGMDELNFWCMRLTKRLAGIEDPHSKLAVELLMDLINDINLCELRMIDNLSRLGLVA
jgi:hypothetical protein